LFIVIRGMGIDLIENRRFQQELAQDEWKPESGIFTREEVRACRSGKHHDRRYAACFAVKEAALKALGVCVGDLAIFREVEVRFGPAGPSAIVLRDRLKSEAGRLGVRRVHLSIAAARKQTGAMVVLES